MDIRITHVIELSGPLMSLLMSSVAGAAISAGASVSRAASAKNVEPAPNAAPVADAPSGGDTVGAVSGEVDAAGWPWDESLHASTKGTTKDGLWRMKVGVSRPAPKPGFPKETGGTGTPANGTMPAASATASSAPATSTGEDDDEFAAFRAAADKANGTDAAAAASIPARKWTDADLGALCNQAAVKLGDPAPVKALIAEFVPDGIVPHSRNIPADERENFAQAVELKAGIEFAG